MTAGLRVVWRRFAPPRRGEMRGSFRLRLRMTTRGRRDDCWAAGGLATLCSAAERRNAGILPASPQDDNCEAGWRAGSLLGDLVSWGRMSRKHKPRLGQNFLSDHGARQRIAEALGDVSAATVVEIGPGHGAITELLATRAKRLIAVELDRALATELRFRFRNDANVEIVEADVLDVDLPGLVRPGKPLDASGEDAAGEDAAEEVASGEDAAGEDAAGEDAAGEGAAGEDATREPQRTAEGIASEAPAVIVGNLPYYITSDILLQLFRASLAAPGVFGSAVVMMQREVAERVASAPGRREFGLLSATAQMHAAAEILFTLGPESFSSAARGGLERAAAQVFAALRGVGGGAPGV